MEVEKRKKTGGRKAGIPNRTTQEMRDFLQSFLSRKFDDLDEAFEMLEPKDKISAIVKMLPYLLPRQMQMDLNATHTQEVKHDLSKLSTEELLEFLELIEKSQPQQINN